MARTLKEGYTAKFFSQFMQLQILARDLANRLELSLSDRTIRIRTDFDRLAMKLSRLK